MLRSIQLQGWAKYGLTYYDTEQQANRVKIMQLPELVAINFSHVSGVFCKAAETYTNFFV